MEPCDAMSIAEGLIQRHAKDIGIPEIFDSVYHLATSRQEKIELADEVNYLIENAKVTVVFADEESK
jgi:hypothetical protein